MLFTVEYDRKGMIEIHVDREGVDLLLDRLRKLKERGGHDHLMTPSWSGNELTEEQQGPENELIHHLCIRFWPE